MLHVIDGARCFQAMVPMRDGVRLNTFVLSARKWWAALSGDSAPYALRHHFTRRAERDRPDQGLVADPKDPLRGSILRGWREIVRRGYAAVYQDTRGRYGSEGEDHVYGDDATDGYDTLAWIASEPWSNHHVGLSGSSAGATTALAAASQCHPSVRAFFAQVGGSSIYDDVVYEGQSIEMERLWLWVARNIPGLSPSHREAVMRKYGLTAEQLTDIAKSANARYLALDAARQANPPLLIQPTGCACR